jgi:phosphoglycerate dehydrogenase-like enzyme
MTEAGGRETKVICIAHPAYRLAEAFTPLAGQRVIVARNAEELKAALPEADVLLASFLWRNEYADVAPRLRFIQSISAGTDQFSREILKSRGIRLASAQGANERVVAEHAIALILAMTRHLGQARDNQHARRWAGMISDPAARQQELGGRTLVIVGLGRIGTRLAKLARAFDLEVIGVRRSPRTADDIVDEVVPPDRLLEVLPRADFLALTCPLTPETERLIRAEHFAAMKFGAYLINVARGKVVDEPALIEALSAGRIAGAGLDCFVEEPLPQDSPLWSFPNVLVTPHSAGETNRYEANVISIFSENLDRLARGEELRNGIL